MKIYRQICYFSQFNKVLLTGIQPTGDIHIGNYLGSIQNMLYLQQNINYNKKYLMIADLHSLTTAVQYDHSQITFNRQIGKDTFKIAKLLLASGVNPKKLNLFVQSDVSAHSQLTWIFGCISPQHWLNTMIQFKQKSHQQSSIGLYTYPVLMAVDILLYRASDIPVGIDQKQHIELTNKIGERFNFLFKNQYFPKVNYVESNFPKIMSLSDPTKKMSKSDGNKKSRILLSDSKEELYKKIRSAVTDSNTNVISFQPQKREGLSNLLRIYSALSNKNMEQIIAQLNLNKITIPVFKQMLFQKVWSKLSQIQQNLKQLNDASVKNILKECGEKAQEQAKNNLKQIKYILGLYV